MLSRVYRLVLFTHNKTYDKGMRPTAYFRSGYERIKRSRQIGVTLSGKRLFKMVLKARGFKGQNRVPLRLWDRAKELFGVITSCMIL